MRYFYDFEFAETPDDLTILSLGIVAEDGRCYYTQSISGCLSRTEDYPAFVQEQVLPKMRSCLSGRSDESHLVDGPCNNDRMHCPWRYQEQMREEVCAFIGADENVELWGYYADYDHVLLGRLFGTMMDWPPTWPMYTRDLKQLMDEHVIARESLPAEEEEHNALADAKWNQAAYREIQRRLRCETEPITFDTSYTKRLHHQLLRLYQQDEFIPTHLIVTDKLAEHLTWDYLGSQRAALKDLRTDALRAIVHPATGDYVRILISTDSEAPTLIVLAYDETAHPMQVQELYLTYTMGRIAA